VSTKFSVDSSSHFPFEARTHTEAWTHTHTHTHMQTHTHTHTQLVTDTSDQYTYPWLSYGWHGYDLMNEDKWHMLFMC